jgi:2,3-bisphosphoglycerate-dependent phosphoglycerate mutase
MAVGIKLGSVTDEIGAADFFHSFFSTVAGNLEPEGWGSRFPILMTKLYNGELHQKDASNAIDELNHVVAELSKLSTNNVIWDIENIDSKPPWGSEISESITDLSNYFITSTGRDLLEVLREIINDLAESGGVARVVRY